MRSIGILLTLLSAGGGFASIFGDCDYQAPRTVSAPATGITHIVVIARAGSLRVEGRRGSAEVRASGTACTSSRETLDRVQLTANRSGSELRIEAVIPVDSGFFSRTTLDFAVTIPSDIANVSIDDTSGGLEIRNLNGNLDVVDTSGEMTIENVAGDVRITDTSGSITVEHAGSVTIVSDTSGSVDLRDIKRNTVIESKTSGSIDVTDVGGDFRVDHKGSGSISYERVRGRVDVPRRR